MKCFVSGGGTGGHFFPALALLEGLVERDRESYFVGSERGIEYRLRDMIPVKSLFLPSHPFMGRGAGDRIRAIFKNLNSSLRIAKLISKGDKGVVFGGYASLPLGIASILKRASLYIHEQNSVPSQSNRLLSRFAEKIFITFEYSRRFLPSDRTIRTGLPVRKSLIEGLKISRDYAINSLGLEDRTTLLVMGGSQGASFLNSIAKEIFLRTGWQGIHITGERDYKELRSFYQERELKVLALPFYQPMHLLYRASTIALSRSGASSIAELSLYGIPTLFIPFPYAVYDHQFYNAKEIEEGGGALVFRQEGAEVGKVIKGLELLLEDHKEFSKRISTFSNPFACEEIIKYI
ncbi:MAG: UDP-N-acetylglucosamine--N-acetylmuramyl-(pentapeptide) pyrophosphoryl-undecaprenol N-acetylglucosamine transferase [Aquificaceae bacterium]